MNKKGELGKIIVYSVITAIIFLLIYSWWFEYPVTGRIIDEGGEILNKLESVLSSHNFSSSNQGQISCKADLDERIRVGRERYDSDAVKLVEAKTFQNLDGAIEYIKKWQERAQQESTINNLNKRYVKQEEIPIMIVKQKSCVMSLDDCYYDIIIVTCDGDKHLVLG